MRNKIGYWHGKHEGKKVQTRAEAQHSLDKLTERGDGKGLRLYRCTHGERPGLKAPEHWHVGHVR